MREHLPLQRRQLGAGVDAQLVGEQPGDPAVRGQRVGLPARPVQRRDQQRPQPFPQRMDRDQRLQLADELAGRAEREPCGEPVLGQPQPGLVEPHPVRRHPVGRPRGGQDLGAEQREPRPAGRGGRGRVARGELGGALVGEPQRLQRVDPAGSTASV